LQKDGGNSAPFLGQKSVTVKKTPEKPYNVNKKTACAAKEKI
jgi:hypothetical protein